MGRIDEALRRVGSPPAHGEQTNAREELFSAAWPLAEDGVPLSAPRAAEASPLFELDESNLPAGPYLRVVRPALAEGLKAGWKERLAISGECDPLLSEQFRQLAANLVNSRRAGDLKTVLVTSAAPADGKTLVALNLAMILSGSYRQRVLLIDADLRRPSIGEALNLKTPEGLSEAIKSKYAKKVSLLPLTETLALLPAGRPDPDPLSGLTSHRMQAVLAEAKSRFDWVIVDTPPLGAAADAGLLSPIVDGVLLVVRAQRTPHAAIQRAIEALGRERILGVVLNAIQHQKASGYYNYYYSHHQEIDR